MTMIITILIVVVVLFIVSMFLPVKGVKSITTIELRDILNKKNHEFIDVRTPVEFKRNNIKQFKNIPLQHLDQNVKKVSKDKEIIVICQSGIRSMQACKRLKHSGFENVTNVKGGMNSW